MKSNDAIQYNDTSDTSQFDVEEFYGNSQLRWYQQAARAGILKGLQLGKKRIIVVLPTGAGKTITIAASCAFPAIRAELGCKPDEKLRVLFCSHRNRLLTQAEAVFATESGIELITQSIFSDIPKDVLDAGWHVTLFDEVHHESCLSIQLQLERLGDKPIIGLTATPERPSGEMLKFNWIVAPLSREEAVQQGYLAETEIFSFVDASGTYKTPIIKDILNMCINQMGQTLVFVKTRKEVTEVTEAIQSHGKTAVALLNQGDKETEQILNDFSSRKLQFLVNCNKLGEGVDLKGCSDVLIARQLGSYVALNQIVGRCSRPDSDCRVWELISPLSSYNLETTAIVGTPKDHTLHYKQYGKWFAQKFDYVSKEAGRETQFNMN